MKIKIIIVCIVQLNTVTSLPRSIYSGAFGPISMAIAPAPPVGRALPSAYMAISAVITTAKRPK